MSLIQRARDFLRRFLSIVGAIVVAAAIIGAWAWSKGWDPRSLFEPQSTPPPSMAAASPAASPASQPHLLRVGVDDRAACLPFSAVTDFLDPDARRLRIQIVPVPDPEVRWQMLAAGRIDLACGTLDSFTLAAGRFHVGAMIFQVGSSSGEDVLLAAPGVTTLSGLAGKKVAVVAGEAGSYLLGYFLDRVGMSPSEVQTVKVSDVRDAAALLQAGKVSGAWLWNPYGSSLATRGFRILASSQEQNLIQEICVARPGLLADRKDDVEAFMRAWFTLINLVNANPGLAREPIARSVHLRAAEVGALLSDVQFADLNENKRLDPNQIVDRMRHIQDFYKITGAVLPAQVIDYANALRLDLLTDMDVSNPTSIFGHPEASPGGSGP